MFRFATQPLSIWRLYGQGFALYKEVFSKVWWLVFINALMVGAINFFMGSVLGSPGVTAWQQLAHGHRLGIALGLSIGSLITIYLISIIIHRIYTIGSGSGVSVGQSAMVVMHKLFTLILAEFFMLLVVLLGFVLPLATKIVGMVLLAMCLPLVFSVFLAFCVPLILLEDCNLWSAIIGSIRLVTGNWWRTAMVLLIPGLVLLSYSIVDAALFRYFNDRYISNGLLLVLISLLNALVYSFILVQYNDLRFLKRV
jgi:hypothetical protein